MLPRQVWEGSELASDSSAFETGKLTLTTPEAFRGDTWRCHAGLAVTSEHKTPALSLVLKFTRAWQAEA